MLEKEIARKDSRKAKRKKQLATEYLNLPDGLVGKDIVHQFLNDNGKEQLWDGKIIAYDANTKMHTVTYSGDSEHYTYDLSIDINNEDLWIML